MDNAVALVQAYLHVNGYFTVTEYPVIEAMRSGGYQMATDLDILAFRFPGAGRLVLGQGGRETMCAPDPELGCPDDKADMIIGEVKEGRAEINRSAKDPAVLRAALTRFGCCPASRAESVVQKLLHQGHTETPAGHRVRLVAFGATVDSTEARGYQVVSLGHAVRYLQEHLGQHWEILRHAHFKSSAFGFLLMMEKALRGEDLLRNQDGD